MHHASSLQLLARRFLHNRRNSLLIEKIQPIFLWSQHRFHCANTARKLLISGLGQSPRDSFHSQIWKPHSSGLRHCECVNSWHWQCDCMAIVVTEVFNDTSRGTNILWRRLFINYETILRASRQQEFQVDVRENRKHASRCESYCQNLKYRAVYGLWRWIKYEWSVVPPL